LIENYGKEKIHLYIVEKFVLDIKNEVVEVELGEQEMIEVQQNIIIE